MKKFIGKPIKAVKDFPKSAFYLFGGSPAGYWGWLVLVFGSMLAGAITFGIYLFVSTNNLISAEITIPEERRLLTVDRDALTETFKVIEKREKEYADALTNPPVEDPAL